ncbi:arsenate reductase (thioredoxin) [Staphylococcus simulans]|uniref:Arsenate reductase n=1 Tax=Staphylococcus simulans TaxID=1286 RepID=A0A6N2Z7N8_STASI|nr:MULTISPECIES: arsenate reductase (thioredoxin) [Staphylococcus]MBO0385761.1 arsenate reductase (thioredoxin) [Staphylococcus simulans]MBU6942610.1 arsenate reductase (thioredoxin) [Staphylococcus sp. CWZ226]MDN6062184.1 arsenate reductase (thioredoxin) [Staphylococcus simulans]MDN6205655.1 arsenate reductase (thioredoxin) [Staphylococcus simulans]MDN6656715.1 arsenate reductase (thioredoxin) [Staphylococcus simulans]
MDKPIIYFICTGNACRSQMAEGFGKVILGDNWTVMSGGIEAHGVNPHAVKAMQEVNIDISDQTSDKIDIDLLNKAKLVVTLCDHAEAHCPVVPNHVKKVHWGFEDPAGKDWSVFQKVRDQIGQRILQFKDTKQ